MSIDWTTTTTADGSHTRTTRQLGVQIRSIEDVANLANLMFRGGCQPPGIDRPEKLAVVILAGLDVGLAPTQSVGSIMLTGGKPAIYGDGALALVRASGLLVSIQESVSGDGDDRKATCVIRRKGDPDDRTFTFSMSEAKQAKLIERAKGHGPWATYPDRMLLMRARGYALRDVFPDVLRGLITYEEAADMLPVEIVVTEKTKPELPPANEAKPDTPAIAAPGVSEEQIAEIRRLLGLGIASKGLMPDDAAGRKAFVEDVLKPFGVQSGKDLTAEQAGTLIKQLGEQYDPFSYGVKVPY